MSIAGAEIIRSADALAAVMPEWRDLWRRATDATPFQAPEWLLSWWQVFAPGELRTVIVRSQDRLLGIAPFYRETGAYGARLLPLGISLSDYTDILAEPADADRVGEVLASAIAEMRDIDGVELSELPPHALASRISAPAEWSLSAEEASACPVVILPNTIERLREVVSPSRLRHLRTARNRAARRGGMAVLRGDHKNHEMLFAALVRLHTSAWKIRGKPGVFCDLRVSQFHALALPRLIEEGTVRLLALEIGGTVAAVYYGFHHRERAYAYLSGYDPDFAFESPSAILIGLALEEAIREGAREFHFLRGREAYKYEWGAKDRTNICYRFVRTEPDRKHG